jgi:probable F420-dependent oxidoreductase
VEFGIQWFATDGEVTPAQFAKEVEDRGFDRLLLPEHSHIPVSRATPYPDAYGGGRLPDFYKRTYDPFVAASYAAAATTTLRIGTGVCLLALRDPIHTAKEVASIDRLSGGRFDFGVGFGWNADEFDTHGQSFKDRFSLVVERVALIRVLWANDVASFEGRHHRLAPSWSWPKPAGPSAPPVLLGGNGPLSMRHAARWADGWYPTGVQDDPHLKLAVPAFRAMVEEQGRDPQQVRVGLAPAGVEYDDVAAFAANGVDFITALALGDDRTSLFTELDRLAAIREKV